MPLIHGRSKKSFDDNLKSEMREGKSQPQSLAIAYSIQRQARKKKMAEGGMVKKNTLGDAIGYPKMAEGGRVEEEPKLSLDDIMHLEPKKMAEGGIIKKEEEKPRLSLDDIMSLAPKKMAEGGEVDLDDNATEHDEEGFPTMEDSEIYPEQDALDELDEPMDSNEHGDDDMVSKIMRKMQMHKIKRGM
jgi:hypothetical protein